MEANKYTYKVNPGFVAQVMDYMMITESDVAHIAMMIDGNNFELHSNTWMYRIHS